MIYPSARRTSFGAMSELNLVTGEHARRAIEAYSNAMGDPNDPPEVKEEAARQDPIAIDLAEVTDVAVSSLGPAQAAGWMAGFINGVIAARLAEGLIE
jgi:hypothetical protein